MSNRNGVTGGLTISTSLRPSTSAALFIRIRIHSLTSSGWHKLTKRERAQILHQQQRRSQLRRRNDQLVAVIDQANLKQALRRDGLFQHHNPVEVVLVRRRVDAFDLNLIILDRFAGRAQLLVDVVQQLVAIRLVTGQHDPGSVRPNQTLNDHLERLPDGLLDRKVQQPRLRLRRRNCRRNDRPNLPLVHLVILDYVNLQLGQRLRLDPTPANFNLLLLLDLLQLHLGHPLDRIGHGTGRRRRRNGNLLRDRLRLRFRKLRRSLPVQRHLDRPQRNVRLPEGLQRPRVVLPHPTQAGGGYRLGARNAQHAQVARIGDQFRQCDAALFVNLPVLDLALHCAVKSETAAAH
uniref:(northern house mosquito) hypothetical protein n=1 Tax=Culex pipiens TaxID=7175 RepID=A0A8D8AEM5_CULPI